ncbi:hypothetical protein Y032_0330g2685 [Ancylostoma ceylanicum]|uniref:Apple domain-containing protein n=1 Tax=Ancylostoma ceylanicum TaxID=53326 RepID=A0A016RZ94_9BILA|nr:hypothetical protein Y032_0330g2685 [Ancylostoma ceylanicum]
MLESVSYRVSEYKRGSTQIEGESHSGIEKQLSYHFGDPCYLCRCFVYYTDRDVAVPTRPYAMAADGYDTTEDRCLATCRRDERCRAAVYGMVGGRKVFTCEFYEKIDSRKSPVYSPFVNIYIKRASCPLKDDHFESVLMIDADDSSLKRRVKHEKQAYRRNPFEG